MKNTKRIASCAFICAAMCLCASVMDLKVSACESMSDCETFGIDPIQCDTEDLTVLSGLNAEQLGAALHGDLANYAEAFIDAEQEHGVNAVFLCAVAALESGWGKYQANINNIFGWMGASNYMAFDSVEECIDHVASNIAQNYLSEDGKHYSGVSVGDVNTFYNGHAEWATEVKEIMLEIQDRL